MSNIKTLSNKLLLLPLFFLFNFCAPVSERTTGSRCIGAENCKACSNCKYCRLCNSGGSCGVCSPRSVDNTLKNKAEEIKPAEKKPEIKRQKRAKKKIKT